MIISAMEVAKTLVFVTSLWFNESSRCEKRGIVVEILEIPRHLLDKIDRKHLEQFMRNEGLEHSGTKEMLIDDLIKQINSESDSIEKNQLIASYQNFLLKTIKHNNNRLVITFPIVTTTYSSYYSVKNIVQQFDVPDISSLNYSDVIFGKKLKYDEFNEIFRHVHSSNGLVDLIEICYAKVSSYRRKDEKEVTTYEYVWCEINPKQNTLLLTMSMNSNEFIKTIMLLEIENKKLLKRN